MAYGIGQLMSSVGSPDISPHWGEGQVEGHPGGGRKGACVVSLAPLPAGGRAVENCPKEHVSKM
ncbi:hypothetical protein VT03_06595 [Planctomyces sp. SH-PL14]|nr:hypothetical protein VT03_06595 [Planctomyces sp. SH-PL14]